MTSKRSRYLRTIRAMSGATQYEARLVWQRLEGWLDLYDRISSAAIERHPRKVAEFLSLARGFVPPGWKVEVTLRTKGGVYRRDGKRVVDRRPLYLKIVVTAREAWPIAEHERAVRLTLRAGAVPKGFKIKAADWEKGKAYGSIARVPDLIAFYGAVRHPNTQIRADMVAED